MLKIRQDGDKVLRQVCKEVSFPYADNTIKTLREMVEYLKKSQDSDYAESHGLTPGIGLAAPQIGIDERMFAIYLTDDDKKTYCYGLINPKIERTSVKKAYLKGGEGCLSVPKHHEGLVPRYYKVVISGYDVISEKDITITAYGYLAIAIQHEYDHLDGILYYDRIDKKDPFKAIPDSYAV